MENPIKMDDLGGTIIFGNTHIGNHTDPVITRLTRQYFIKCWPWVLNVAQIVFDFSLIFVFSYSCFLFFLI